MKYNYTFLIIVLLVSACGSSQYASKGGRNIDYASMSTLADALRLQSGVQVVGSAHNTKVSIRGVNTSKSSVSETFTSSPTAGGPVQRQTTVLKDVEPLFLVDGTIVGNSYNQANRVVNVQDIVSIKVLKSYSETNAFGEQGKNGVIKITTQQGATVQSK
ncbi:MAG: hypothetical protein KTR30_19940 [Saprospiraceae bacterium]|nr:hypothetical protein [Saprospiraceae bacterium]